MAIEWASVESSQLTRVGFDPETSKGYVGFINHRTNEEGSVYEYDDCTVEEKDAIVNAESCGRAFASSWKYGKAYRKISG